MTCLAGNLTRRFELRNLSRAYDFVLEIFNTKIIFWRPTCWRDHHTKPSIEPIIESTELSILKGQKDKE